MDDILHQSVDEAVNVKGKCAIIIIRSFKCVQYLVSVSVEREASKNFETIFSSLSYGCSCH